MEFNVLTTRENPRLSNPSLLRLPLQPSKTRKNHETMALSTRRSFPDAGCRAGSRSDRNPKFHSGFDDADVYDRNDHNRDRLNRTVWRRIQQLFWHQHGSGSNRLQQVHSSHSRWGLSVRSDNSYGGYNRNGRHYEGNRTNNSHQYLKYLLPVGLFFCQPSFAQNDGTTAIANPVATSSGQVSNQAVQINQGGYSKQSFGVGHSCNSSTLTFTPFYLGNDTHPNYIRGQNFGIQATISIPLNREMVRQCKQLAKTKLDKERLNYALARAIKCAELLNLGYMIRPDSPYAVVCADVAPIAREPKSVADSASKASESSQSTSLPLASKQQPPS